MLCASATLRPVGRPLRGHAKACALSEKPEALQSLAPRGAIDEVENLARHARVRGPDREQLRHMVVSEALPEPWSRMMSLDELPEQLREWTQISRIVPLCRGEQHR